MYTVVGTVLQHHHKRLNPLCALINSNTKKLYDGHFTCGHLPVCGGRCAKQNFIQHDADTRLGTARARPHATLSGRQGTRRCAAAHGAADEATGGVTRERPPVAPPGACDGAGLRGHVGALAGADPCAGSSGHGRAASMHGCTAAGTPERTRARMRMLVWCNRVWVGVRQTYDWDVWCTDGATRRTSRRGVRIHGVGVLAESMVPAHPQTEGMEGRDDRVPAAACAARGGAIPGREGTHRLDGARRAAGR